MNKHFKISLIVAVLISLIGVGSICYLWGVSSVTYPSTTSHYLDSSVGFSPYDYIIEQRNSTHYQVVNGTNGHADYKSTNSSKCQRQALGNLTTIGTVFLKNIPFDQSLVPYIAQGVIVIQSYSGTFTYFTYEEQIVPPPTGDYDWIFDKSGSNYQVLYGSNSSLIYQSTTSATAWNYLLGSNGIAPASSSVHVLAGSYTVTTSWTIYKASVQITCNSSAHITLANGVNTQPILAIYANGVIINGGEWDGNGVNQLPIATTMLSPSANFWTAYSNGILIFGSYCTIERAYVHDCRCCGIVSMWLTSYHDNAVVNCTVVKGGANGIMVAGSGGANCIFINNVVWGWADVGIDTYGVCTKITGNNIYKNGKNGTTPFGGYEGSVNSGDGIGIEGNSGSGSGYQLIAYNRINDSYATTTGPNGGRGILVAGGSPTNTIIQGNVIINHRGAQQWNGIDLVSVSNFHIEYNYIRNFVIGVYLESGSSNNVYGITYNNCSTNFSNGGTGTTQTSPSIVAIRVTSSPSGVTGLVSADGSYGYAGIYSTSPYVLYATVTTSVSLVATSKTGYTYSSWSDSGAQTHSITVPATNYTYTATFSP